MISRHIYRAQCIDSIQLTGLLEMKKKEIEKRMHENQLLTLSIFQWEKQIFLYYECTVLPIDPHQLLSCIEDAFDSWPGQKSKRYWLQMVDIFHYNEPQNLEHWTRKKTVEKKVGRIACLKPEMVASYIYYHYQYQEEKPGDGDKYGIIGLHEQLIFFYKEEPEELEKTLYKGKLDTKNKPSNWDEVMAPHFDRWQDVEKDEEIWRLANCLIDLKEKC